MTRSPFVEFRNVVKRFGERTILDGVDLTVFKGEITTIIGKSGAGKSVLLKHIIGLLKPDSGEILFEGRPLRSMSKAEWKQLKRKVSYMFQQNALFDSMNVFDNVALPLRERTRMPAEEIRKKVMARIEQFELSEVTDKFPSQISGGMQKRVALARALVTDPSIILFDEPTTGLDPLRKNTVLSMIAHHQREIGFTAVMVSHDIPDVFLISNRVAIIEDKRIPFQGTPVELEQSDDPLVQQFIRGQESLADELTGLLTRPDLEQKIRQELTRIGRFQKTFSVVLFVIDDLEHIREKVGFIAAQRIVQCLGNLLKGHLGTTGMSARFSQNEILTVLPHTDLSRAQHFLEDLAGRMKDAETFQAKTYPRICLEFYIKAGIAQANSGASLESLIEQARSNLRTIAHLECTTGRRVSKS